MVVSPAMTSLSDYELGETLGQGAFGRTVAATHKASGRDVAVKILRLAGLPDWKPVELLEREAKVLRSLVHPGIPAFVEAFEDHGDAADESGEASQPAEVQLCIVTARVSGETLAARLERGDRWTTAQAERLTRELLETLAYLHELSPPVVHRDVTPGNVMIDAEGRAMLVDFGAVRSLSHQPGQAQTVLGTPGYMAPEQAMGEATPASDLYGLGATLAHVLTHQHPSQLPREGLRISVEGLLGDAGAAARVLPGLLAPEVAARHASARAALAVLDGAAPASLSGPAALPAAAGPAGDATTQALALREAEVMQALTVARPVTPAVHQALASSAVRVPMLPMQARRGFSNIPARYQPVAQALGMGFGLSVFVLFFFPTVRAGFLFWEAVAAGATLMALFAALMGPALFAFQRAARQKALRAYETGTLRLAQRVRRTVHRGGGFTERTAEARMLRYEVDGELVEIMAPMLLADGTGPVVVFEDPEHKEARAFIPLSVLEDADPTTA